MSDAVIEMDAEKKEILIEKMTDNLPVLRKKLRLSQDELAKIIGSTRFTVMLLETKKRKMTWPMFLLLALMFEKNRETSVLVRALEIYTDELDEMIRRDVEHAR